ncbi:uncharacterized protein SPSK_10781 [Sporothrix schenckii 1099-18]|uniref:Uncharacterized protein n=1 Tax=Sporothrix schenckii 1099-18 TaxID=1397361 RepID=A0A0F2MIH4_SPOSC|nr:uncharacterized protein SPSK_10781 [Sporothrix schenckii 1099-18]KJR88869.1 hypothetical protein SPSK_10781 [Sporothrix schenckii 1099-18]
MPVVVFFQGKRSRKTGKKRGPAGPDASHQVRRPTTSPTFTEMAKLIDESASVPRDLVASKYLGLPLAEQIHASITKNGQRRSTNKPQAKNVRDKQDCQRYKSHKKPQKEANKATRGGVRHLLQASVLTPHRAATCFVVWFLTTRGTTGRAGQCRPNVERTTPGGIDAEKGDTQAGDKTKKERKKGKEGLLSQPPIGPRRWMEDKEEKEEEGGKGAKKCIAGPQEDQRGSQNKTTQQDGRLEVVPPSEKTLRGGLLWVQCEWVTAVGRCCFLPLFARLCCCRTGQNLHGCRRSTR